MSLLKPVCVPCQRFMRPKQNGYFFLEGMPAGMDFAPPGLAAPDKWKPYKIWVGDLYHCPDCGAEIVVGVVGGPLAEHFQPDFGHQVEIHNADQLLVKDC